MFNYNSGTQWFWKHWFETSNGTIGSNNKLQLSIQFERKEISNILAKYFLHGHFCSNITKKNYTKEYIVIASIFFGKKTII